VGAFKVTRRLRHRVYRSTTLAGSDENQRFQEEAAAQARVCRKAGEHWRQLASIPSSLVSPDDPNPGNPTKPGCSTDSCSEPIFEATCHCQFAYNYPYAFGPRLGAAYQVDTKTVLNAGIGVVYGAATV